MTCLEQNCPYCNKAANLTPHGSLADTHKPLPIELAQYSAGLKPGDDRWKRINRLYNWMLPAAQVAFRNKLLECRNARRGYCEAEVVANG